LDLLFVPLQALSVSKRIYKQLAITYHHSNMTVTL